MIGLSTGTTATGTPSSVSCGVDYPTGFDTTCATMRPPGTSCPSDSIAAVDPRAGAGSVLSPQNTDLGLEPYLTIAEPGSLGCVAAGMGALAAACGRQRRRLRP
ncbi:MAG TPA: hypothetical protein VHS58_08575 [Acetobacteraceae bacterium]|nr:hypothetical protein [Acetobacteraceae bacterium]